MLRSMAVIRPLRPVRRSRWLPIAGIPLLAIAAGCGHKQLTAPSNDVPLTLRAVAAGPVAGAAARSTVSGDTIPVTYATVLLVVREVRFRLAESEADDSLDTDGDDDDKGTLGFASAAGDSGDGDDDHGDAQDGGVLFRGPFVVDLLAQSSDSLDTQMVPPGTYRSTKGHVRPLRADDWNASAFPALVNSTVYLQGTVDGEGGGEFTYLASFRHTFKIKGEFTVAANTPATAFLTFDISNWLRGRDGAFLDPRDPANDRAIRQAIKRSIRAGMDDDHDGRSDDRTHGEGH